MLVELRELVPQAIERVQQQYTGDDDADQYGPKEVARRILADARELELMAISSVSSFVFRI